MQACAPPDTASSGSRAGRARSGVPAWVLPAAGLLAPLVAVLVWRHGRVPLNSDSVAQQSIVRTWFAAGHADTYLPPDTWLLKIPVYLVVESLPLAPTTRVLVETVTLNAIGFALMAWAAWWFAGVAGTRLRRDAVLPLVWVMTLGGGIASYLSIMPNYRNIELGLSFLTLALAGRFLRGRPVTPTARTGGVAAVAALLLALLWVDDPYFAFLVGLPLMLLAPLWYAVRRRDPRLLVLSAMLGASLLAIPVLRLGLAAAGIHVVPDTTGPTLSPAEFLGHVPILWPSIESQLGLAERGAAASAAHALALAVLAAGVVAGGYLAVRGWRSRDLLLTFLGGHWFVVVAGVLANRTIYDFHAGRYLVLAFYDLAITLGVAAAALRGHRPRLAAGITGLLVAAVLANGAATVAGRPDVPPEVARQSGTLAALQATGATKGYTHFWAANLYTHLSEGRVLLSDVVCDGGRLRLRLWLTDTARTRLVPPPGQGVVLLWDPAADNFRGCSLDGVRRQLGEPARVLPGPSGQSLLIYAEDPVARFDPAREP